MSSKAKADNWVPRLGSSYILLMMILTRLCGSIGGVLVVYYVNLALTLPDQIRRHFHMVAAVVVTLSVVLTLLLALWETRRLRSMPIASGLGNRSARTRDRKRAGRPSSSPAAITAMKPGSYPPPRCCPPRFFSRWWTTRP